MNNNLILQSMKTICSYLILSFILLLVFQSSYSQTSGCPDINFNLTDTNYKIPVKKIYKTLLSYKIEPTLDMQTRMLNEILSGIYNPDDFIIIATKYNKRYNKLMYEEFVRNIKTSLVDSSYSDYLIQSAAVNMIDTSHFEGFGFKNTISEFICFDFDKDGKPDMFSFPKVYFGPSLGLAFYGRVNGKFQYLFDNSGWIAEIKDNKDRILMRYVMPIIDVSETYIQIGRASCRERV